MNLKGATFIITGGASGLGEGTAQVFVESGANVIVADLNPETGERAAAALGAQARFALCDVASEESVRNTVNAALEHFGGLHGAVNCAGIAAAVRVCGKHGPHPLDLFQKVIEVNLTGSFNIIRVCADAMVKLDALPSGERGVFINTASVAAFDGQIGQAAYAASKGGLVSMALPLARELARYGIRVATIAPGIFDTPMLAALPEEVRQSLAAQIPFPQRLGSPREFGELAKHIIENEMLNAICIRLDGGIRMQAK